MSTLRPFLQVLNGDRLRATQANDRYLGIGHRIYRRMMEEFPIGTDSLDRLERMIERLVTQRACLDFAAEQTAKMPGPVLEVGLGKGRTYDHLRKTLPEREIFAFDRDVHAPADAMPDPERLYLGDFRDSLERAASALGRQAIFAHADIGSENRVRDAALAAAIAPLLNKLVVAGGLVITDRPMICEGWQEVDLPAGVGRWPYYIYRVS